MKKQLLVLFTLIASVSFAQMKYVTFTDTLRFQGAGNTYFYNIAELPDEQAYFTGGGYDDLSYELKHYIAKLDFKGDMLWDTVYHFDEDFPGNGSVDMDVQLIETNGMIYAASQANQMTEYFTSQPFIYAITPQGNVDWNWVLFDDLKDFTGIRIAPDNNGGVYMSATKSDGGGFQNKAIASKQGVIYSLDGAGNLQWSQAYGNKDTLEFGFDVLTTNMASEIFVAGRASVVSTGQKPIEPWENLINIAKISPSGDVDWNNALHFDSIVNPVNVKSINVVDNNTLMVLFEYYNMNKQFDEGGIVSLDINTGATNWIKGYSLAGNGGYFYDSKALTKDGRLVVVYDNNNEVSSASIMKINQQGNIVHHAAMRENGNSNFNKFSGMYNTSDEGMIFLMTPNSGKGTNILKTDYFLNTYCPDVYQSYIPDIIDLTATSYVIMDTVIDYSPNPVALTMQDGTQEPVNVANSCRCNLDVDGTVYDVIGMGMDSVRMALYRYDAAPGHYTVVGDMMTDAQGNYNFEFLPEGQYVVKAVPDAAKHPDYNQTYFADPVDVTQWDSATVINLSCALADTVYNIDLFQTVPQAGMWTCNGYVIEFYGYEGQQTKKAPGDPLGDIDITVEQSPGGAISSTTTDEFGYYEFNGLNNNATFIIRPDLPGLPNDSIYTLTVNPGDDGADSLNFYVDSVGVYILPDTLFTGVAQPVQFFAEQVNLMPNPTKGLVNISFLTKNDLATRVEIVDLLGKVVYQNNLGNRSGEVRLNVDLTNFTEGVYFVKITREQQFIIRKLMKQ